MSNYLIDIEDAVISKVNAARRPDEETECITWYLCRRPLKQQ